jgi:hypothetical protein
VHLKGIESFCVLHPLAGINLLRARRSSVRNGESVLTQNPEKWHTLYSGKMNGIVCASTDEARSTRCCILIRGTSLRTLHPISYALLGIE